MSFATRVRRWALRRAPQSAQAILNHRCIYVLPNARGAVFIILLLLMLLAAMNYQKSLAYVMTFILGSLLHSTIVYTYRNLSGLKLSLNSGRACFVGDLASFQLVVESPRKGRQQLRFRISEYWKNLDHLRGGREVVDIEVAASKRGWLQAPPLEVETDFPMGLIRAWSWQNLSSQVLVYPHPLAPPERLAQRGGGDGDKPNPTPGQEDYQGMRPYHFGDSPRHLAWKALASEKGLFTKVFDAAVSDDMWFEWDAFSGIAVERRLSYLTWQILEADRRNLIYGMKLPGTTLGPASSKKHFKQCLQALALFEGGTAESHKVEAVNNAR
ncbi:DUF58 domain-containing protein [Pelagibaculum spongiae]|uniref:DUF58 domain-containing protein n=1 Tax=Pelagibaculum spongiae TaxID=2080658 RepID=A0A2V1H144_9GAMM|nr:DUF58 domain-containing protein [Pelagibaculum spongiae]PVZ71680.1 DUF58 domain-containing protein [Pelagibaculum spongiae]